MLVFKDSFHSYKLTVKKLTWILFKAKMKLGEWRLLFLAISFWAVSPSKSVGLLAS